MHIGKVKISNSKGVELVWWTVAVFVIAIVVLIIFMYFISSGSLQVESLLGRIFGAPEHFANTS